MLSSKNVFKENTSDISLANESGIEETAPEISNSNPESASPKILAEPPTKVMPTLPKAFKSLVDTPIDITDENRKPDKIIELLGDALGISDYKTNMASFWFLDFIALQVLQHEATLNGHGRSVMVSWLAGEMKLIQEKNLSRESFFEEMEEIFLDCLEKLGRGHAVLHWDLMSVKSPKEDIAMQENMKQEQKEAEESTPKIAKSRAISNLDQKSESSEKTLRRRNGESQVNINDNSKEFTKLKDNPHNVLDVIIEATYSMLVKYSSDESRSHFVANNLLPNESHEEFMAHLLPNIHYICCINCRYGYSFHYALIVAAFVKPVPLLEYSLPFTLRIPRPVKVFDEAEHEKKRIIEKRQNSVAAREANEINKKTKESKRTKKKSNDVESIKVATEPSTPEVLIQEEILARRREFILPLMEANEAPSILETHAQANIKRKSIVGLKKKTAKLKQKKH